METGIAEIGDQVSKQSTAEMGDLGLLNVIAMSPAMSAAATISLGSHRFSTPRTMPSNKNLTVNALPLFSTCGSQTSPPSTVYSQVGTCIVSTQPHVLSSHPISSSVVHASTTSPHYRPHPLVSTPSNNPTASKSSCGLPYVLNDSPNSITQANNAASCNVRPGFQRPHKSLSPTSPKLNQNLATSHSFPSPSNQEFMYKLSKTPACCTAHEMSCNSPLLMSAGLTRNTTPLATQDPNQVQSPRSAFSQHHGANGLMTSVFVHGGQESDVNSAFSKTSDTGAPGQASPREDGGGGRSYSTCSTPSTPQGLGSVNECPSPQVSDLSSEETDHSVPQLTFAESYASLTPWTNKLTMPGYTPLPRPSPDAMPIPLESINSDYMLAMSPSSMEISTQPRHPRPYQTYSRLQPGMVNGGFNSKTSNGKTMKNGTINQKANFKMLPNKEHRFKRTADALQKSGLWEVAMKTGNLIKRNRELQRELEQFRSDALTFLKSVIKNPQNRDFIKNVLNNALASNSTPRNGTSVMTVVVSAAAAAAAASVRLDSNGSTDDSMSSNNST